MNKAQFRRATLYIFSSLLFIAAFCAPAFASAEGSFQKTMTVTGTVNLDVVNGSGDIHIHASSGNQVQIAGHIRAGNWMGDDDNAQERVKKLEANPPIWQSGNDIRIGHIDDPELRRNISISYDIVVPENTELHTRTGSGDQQVEGIHGTIEIGAGSGSLEASNIGGSVRAETGSGGIEIREIKGSLHAKAGSGNIHASEIAGGFEGETGSGNISLGQTAPGSVHVRSGSGGLELHLTRGTLDAQTGSGTIRVEGDPTGPWTLHTGSGSVHLKLAPDAGFDLNARTSSGSLSIDEPITVQGNIGKKEIHGKVHGGGAPVSIETGSGDVQIQ
jgi:hypothetical protein